MPTSYPASNDSFRAPDNPSSVVTASSGDSTRNHAQSHQDMGDAIMALETNATPLTHDHSGTEARPSQKLSQANTHQSPDTDTGLGAIHHTLGLGATQAAPGNHTHTNIYLPYYTPYYCRAAFGSAGSPFLNNGDNMTSTGWTATDDVYSLWTAGANPLFTCPATGKWLVYFRAVFDAASNITIGVKGFKNLPSNTLNNTYGFAGDFRLSTPAAASGPHINELIQLTKNDTLRFSVFSNASINLFSNYDYVGDSYMSFKYMGP